MKLDHRKPPRTQLAPSLGSTEKRSGMEPALSQSRIPLRRISPAEASLAPPVAGRRHPLVIVADADDDAVNLLQCLGAQAGYQVRSTSDGAEAWRLIRALEPNLVVISNWLFEIDSYRLAQQIRAHSDPTISGVALLATGSPQDAVQIREFFRAGVDDVLPKPIETGRLLHCWRRLVTGAWRPAPITALVNENEAVREAALSWLLDVRPPGLVAGLRSVLWQPAGRDISRAVLQRLGTPDARAVLSEDKSPVWSGV